MITNKRSIKEHFVTETKMCFIEAQDERLEILVDEKIFPPSDHGSQFTEYIRVEEGERVIDIGTGSGVLGILAARKCGRVVATDTSREAIERSIDNAKRNKVIIDARVGNYFRPFKGIFNVIIANLPQEIIPDTYAAQIGPELAATISGGALGTEHILKVLEEAPSHMDEKSRLYIVSYGLTDYITTLQRITNQYDARLLGIKQGPAKKFVQDEPGWYKRLIEEGTIRIFKKNDLWMTETYFFELRQRHSKNQ